MARVEESHKDHEIVIEEPGGKLELEEEVQEPRLFIDGRPVNVVRRPDGTYSSEGVFYTSYASLSELARASIDTHLAED